MGQTRIVIIGNSGSGKSWLAQCIARLVSIPAIDLDRIHWEDGQFIRARDTAAARQMVRDAADGENWIIEGVFGWLAQETLPRARTLIWLDVPAEECIANIKKRGPYNASDSDFESLLAWASAYDTRAGSSSRSGHERIYQQFEGEKYPLRGREQIDKFVEGFRGEHIGSVRF